MITLTISKYYHFPFRSTKRLRNDSTLRNTEANYRSKTIRDIDGRPKCELNRGSSERSHSNSSDQTSESRRDSHRNRRPEAVGHKNPAHKTNEELQSRLKANITQTDIKAGDKSTKTEVLKTGNPQCKQAEDLTSRNNGKATDITKEKTIMDNESILTSEIPKTIPILNYVPAHNKDTCKLDNNELPKKQDITAALSKKTVITSSKPQNPTKSDLQSHSPDSTTLNEDPKTPIVVEDVDSLMPLPSVVEPSNAPLPVLKLSILELPASLDLFKSAKTPSQPKLEPLPSAFDLFKCDKKPSVENSADQPNIEDEAKISTISSTSGIKSNTRPVPTIAQNKKSEDAYKHKKTTDDISMETCKPITTRRKTMAAVPTTSKRSKPSDPPKIVHRAIDIKKDVCVKNTTYISNTVTSKESIKEPEKLEGPNFGKLKTRNGDNKITVRKTPLNILFDEFNLFTELRAKNSVAKETRHKKSPKPEVANVLPTRITKPIESKPSEASSNKSSNVIVKPDKSSQIISPAQLSRDKPPKVHSIEDKLANLFGSETSDSEHSTPHSNLPDTDLRPCIDNAFQANRTPDILSISKANPRDSINICETPIASLVEHIFSSNHDGTFNDAANVSDASSTSLRVAGETVEQIDLYLTRRKRRSSGKNRFRQRLAMGEMNSSNESKTMDLSDNHNSVSMDVDIELTQKCVHDVQAQTASIISLFDALQTPRKSVHRFEMVEDTGSLFAGIRCRQKEESLVQDAFHTVVDLCDTPKKVECLMQDNETNVNHEVSKQLLNTRESTINDKDHKVSSDPPTNANQYCNSLDTFLTDQSMVPSHQTPTTMDQSFLNMIPIRNQTDRIPSDSNHYEEYLSNVKINDLSTLSDFFGPEDQQSHTKATSTIPITTSLPKHGDQTIPEPPTMVIPIPISQPEDNSNPTPNPLSITTPIPQTPTTAAGPHPDGPTTATSITEESAIINQHTPNTSSHTMTARLSYYVEEDTASNEVTMFITRKKKKKPKKLD